MKMRLKILAVAVLALAAVWWFHAASHSPVAGKKNSPALRSVAAAVSPLSLPKVLAVAGTNQSAQATNPFPYRLANTTKTIGQLAHEKHAILLDNALIATDTKINLPIPSHLRAKGEPGAYVVQARGSVDAAFRAALVRAGAQVVSYIPNNSLLVQLSATGAAALAQDALVQAVLPYDPYFKVQSTLLGDAVQQKSLPAGTFLTLGLYAGNASATVAEIQKLGGQIVATDRSPFGPVVRVQPPADWLALAQLPGVQRVEPTRRRVSANDLSRATLGVASTSTAQTNYLNLTGSNVLVEMNDTGVDTNHPDLQGRILLDSGGSGVDTDGHGTFVAGQIMGNGSQSLTVTNASGSVMPGTNGQFRGMAPLANLFSVGGVGGGYADEGVLGRQNLGGNDDSFYTFGQSNFFIPGPAIYLHGTTGAVHNFFPQYPDWYLQEAPAATNALISNNSWVNQGDNQYDLAAASYDAAVRDALPEVTGPQPVLFVFAAGNGGAAGDDSGGGGYGDTIYSPATAKNVITVGALEQARYITNTYIPYGTTNPVEAWYDGTDSGYQVAGYSSRGNVGIGTEGDFGRFKPDVVAPGSFVVSTRPANWDTTNYYNPTNYYYSGLTDTVDTNSVNYYDLNQFGLTARSNVVGIIITAVSTSPAGVALPIYSSLTNYADASNFQQQTANGTMNIPADTGSGYLSGIVNNNGDFYFSVGNPTNVPVTYDLLVEMITTNDMGNYFEVLSNMNEALCTAPHYYRYESGTSMAAADVSGVLALMQDYFTNTLHTTPSPALLKALLINGARPTGYYNYQVNNSINYEGWGLVNLPNSIRPTLAAPTLGQNNSVFYADQSPTNALATGDTRTYQISVAPAAEAQSLHITLAWTDPPGNPAAAIKLVNSLSLIVTNMDSATNPVVYYGNDIETNQVYNTAQSATNVFQPDNINNVLNVFLPPYAGTNFVIVVAGTAVNANAVTTQTNDATGNYAPNITQDYALVISSGDGSQTNGFTVTTATVASNPTGGQRITVVVSTNTPMMNQIVGSSSPVMSTNYLAFNTNASYATNAQLTIGQTNQWHFYIVTNTGPASDFTNAAFVVFQPNTLSLPREGVFAGSDANSTLPEANLNLFVTTDAALTNLAPVTISNCCAGPAVDASVGSVFNGASLGRGGSKFIVDTNSTPGQVYYVGVQCQDQTAAEYDFLPEFSNIPFSQQNSNGESVAFFTVSVPDGPPNLPGYTNTIGLAIYPIDIRRVIATNVISQQNPGDLVTSLSHSSTAAGSTAVGLLSHFATNAPGVYTEIFDDSGRNDIPGAQPSAGPGSLNQYFRQSGQGIWVMHASDSAQGFLGSIGGGLFIEKHQNLKNTPTLVSVPPGGWFFDFVEVPVGYTNLTVYGVDQTGGGQPLTLAVALGANPTTNSIWSALLNIPILPAPYVSNSVSIGPPLTPGIYIVGVYNPNAIAHTVELWATLGGPSASAETVVDYTSTGPMPLLDDAVNYNYIFVTNTDAIEGFNVGLRVDHPRISDLQFTLVSPDGTRYLLMENRGGQSTNGCGITVITTNVFSASASGTAQPNTNVVNVGLTAGTLPITFNFYTAPDQMTIYYGPTVSSNFLIYDTGVIHNSPIGGGGPQNTYPSNILVNFGPTNGLSSTYLTIVMDEFLPTNRSDFWTYTAGSVATNYYYLSFTEDTNLTTTPVMFAPPPLTPYYSTTSVWTDSFELYNPGSYTNGQPGFGSWTVLTNQVEISTNLLAFDGVQYLQLDNGAVQTNLPTVAGQRYSLAYELGSMATDENGNPATNANWTPVQVNFTAAQSGSPLVLDASGSGLQTSLGSVVADAFDTNALFDDFVLTQLPQNLYYQPEQDMSPLTGTSAFGRWQLEVLDTRAGATNSATLVSWELEFTFANTNLISSTSISNIVGGIAVTNNNFATGISWYAVSVPTNAAYATNLLLAASLPVNVWFTTNYPPSITNADAQDLMPASTNQTVILSAGSAPPIASGETYYLGVENTNGTAVSYALEVDFDHGNSTNSTLPLLVFSSIKVSGSTVQLSWAIGSGATYQVQWKNSLTSAWNTITNPATTVSNSIATFTDNGSQTAPLGAQRFYRLVRTQ